MVHKQQFLANTKHTPLSNGTVLNIPPFQPATDAKVFTWFEPCRNVAQRAVDQKQEAAEKAVVLQKQREQERQKERSILRAELAKLGDLDKQLEARKTARERAQKQQQRQRSVSRGRSLGRER